MKYTYLICDIDGTLLETKSAFCGSLLAVLEKYGIAHGDVSIYFTLPIMDAVRDFGLTTEQYDEWRADYRYRLSIAQPFEGVRDMILSLHKAGVRLAVVTSRKHELATVGLTELGLMGYFDEVVAADDVTNPKPNAEPVLKCLSLAGKSKEETAFIGDATVDMQCAQNAGVAFYAPGWAPELGEGLTPYITQMQQLLAKFL